MRGLGGVALWVQGAFVGAALGMVAGAILLHVSGWAGAVEWGVLFGVGLGMAWVMGRFWARYRLRVAMEAVERGAHEEVEGALRLVASWPVASIRQNAQRILGWTRLQRGDLDGAARAYRRASRGRGAAHGAAGLALVRVLQGRHEEASEALNLAMNAQGARQVQAQVDGVRLLWLWRGEGPEEARRFGERMEAPGAGPLFLGLLAVLRGPEGTLDGVGSPERAEIAAALGASGLLGRVPELALWETEVRRLKR